MSYCRLATCTLSFDQSASRVETKRQSSEVDRPFAVQTSSKISVYEGIKTGLLSPTCLESGVRSSLVLAFAIIAFAEGAYCDDKANDISFWPPSPGDRWFASAALTSSGNEKLAQ